MKVIDLLNKIANKEEVPKKIKYDDTTYIFNSHNGYLDKLDNNIGYYHILDACLNDEVEIIEDKKIKPLFCAVEDEVTSVIVIKINEIIDKINAGVDKE